MAMLNNQMINVVPKQHGHGRPAICPNEAMGHALLTGRRVPGCLESTHQNGDDPGMDIGFTTKSVWKTWM